MATYIAFLRAINLGATRKFPRDAIKAAVERAGFAEVETYINTGNVRFDSAMRSRAKIEATLERVFAEDRGFEVATIVFTPQELARVAADAVRFAGDHDGRHYVSLLKDEPAPAAAREIEAMGRDGESARVGGRAVHLLLGNEYHTARLTNVAVEKLLGVATNRNRTVIVTLAEKWGA